MKTLLKWTVDDYHQMIESNILTDRNCELIDGEIITVSPELPKHYNTAKRSVNYLQNLLADDIYWLIEVVNTSLTKDLSLKQKIYAEAKIGEYWVMNLQTQELIVFRQPEKDRYLVEIKWAKSIINAVAFPEIDIVISQLFI